MPACQKRVPDLVLDGCEPPRGCWELNSGPLEKRSVLSEPSLQLPTGNFLGIFQRSLKLKASSSAAGPSMEHLHLSSPAAGGICHPCELSLEPIFGPSLNPFGQVQKDQRLQ